MNRARARVQAWALPATWRGVRFRSSVGAAIVVALALGGGTALALRALAAGLARTSQSAAISRATQVAKTVRTEGVTGLTADLSGTGALGQGVQVLDGASRVVATSRPRTAAVPWIVGPFSSASPILVSASAIIPALDPDERFLMTTVDATHDEARYHVIVAVPVSSQEEAVRAVASYLVIADPILTLLVAVATFIAVDRTLRPVEAIRRRVESIDHQGLSARVPIPESRDEVARLARTMNSMLERLQSAHDAQERFVADASHELRSPLATLRTSIEVAAADPSGRIFADLHQGMDEEAERMSRLIEDLLILARVDQGSAPALQLDVDLDDVVDSEVRRLRMHTGLVVAAVVVPVRCTGDPRMLAQVVRVLTENARRHAHSRIELSLERRGGEALISVADDGAGVPMAERQRIFERFVRLDVSRTRADGGTGLGLAIAKDIVERHHGRIWLTDRDGGGVRFVVAIPLAASRISRQPPEDARR